MTKTKLMAKLSTTDARFHLIADRDYSEGENSRGKCLSGQATVHWPLDCKGE